MPGSRKVDREEQKRIDTTMACFFVDALVAVPEKAQEMFEYAHREETNPFGMHDATIRRIIKAIEKGTTDKLCGDAKHYWQWAKQNRAWSDAARARCTCH